jgi:hypothetical protein
MNLFLAAVFNILPLRPICFEDPACASARTGENTSAAMLRNGTIVRSCDENLATQIAVALGSSAADAARTGHFAGVAAQDAHQASADRFYGYACDTGLFRKYPDGSTRDVFSPAAPARKIKRS